MEEVLHENEGVRTKAGFYCQEMNREANTILSKANDLETSNLAIDLKTEIEKVGNQIRILNKGRHVYGKIIKYRIWKCSKHG